MPVTIDDLERRRAAADSAPGNYVWPQAASQWARESMELHRAQAAEIESLRAIELPAAQAVEIIILKAKAARLAAQVHALCADDSDPAHAQAAGYPAVTEE